MNPTPIHFMCTIMMGVVYWACVVVCTVCFIANIFLIVVQWSIATFINLSITTRYAVFSDFMIFVDRYAYMRKALISSTWRSFVKHTYVEKVWVLWGFLLSAWMLHILFNVEGWSDSQSISEPKLCYYQEIYNHFKGLLSLNIFYWPFF